ncbi:hypothetical protein HPG69_016664 [Diceros bicornis minor]|uniref:Uncharacterized protein n=1 Tax=Diceros bicornis minor TaxID=77932 RepID=A0A7J7FNN6_DICBM|nr:hypothetical protein HPG69_016664 [Diceros bicornis minor]
MRAADSAHQRGHERQQNQQSSSDSGSFSPQPLATQEVPQLIFPKKTFSWNTEERCSFSTSKEKRRTLPSSPPTRRRHCLHSGSTSQIFPEPIYPRGSITTSKQTVFALTTAWSSSDHLEPLPPFPTHARPARSSSSSRPLRRQSASPSPRTRTPEPNKTTKQRKAASASPQAVRRVSSSRSASGSRDLQQPPPVSSLSPSNTRDTGRKRLWLLLLQLLLNPHLSYDASDPFMVNMAIYYINFKENQPVNDRKLFRDKRIKCFYNDAELE